MGFYYNISNRPRQIELDLNAKLSVSFHAASQSTQLPVREKVIDALLSMYPGAKSLSLGWGWYNEEVLDWEGPSVASGLSVGHHFLLC